MADQYPNIEAAVSRAAGYIQETWRQVVDGTLQVPGAKTPKVNAGLRKTYVDSINVSEQVCSDQSISQSITTQSETAKDLEHGKPKWDMKPMLLGGPKARMGKKGKYNIIPFRHGTSNAHAPDNNFKTMPTNIYKQARQLKASVKGANGMQWGGRLAGTETAHPAGKNPTTGYQHKSGKFEGMVRIEKPHESATQNKFMTFRVVSSNSDATSWWHPGYEAHNIVQGVSAYCKPHVEQMISDAAKQDLTDVVIKFQAGVV